MTRPDTDQPRRAHRSPIRFRVSVGVLVAVLVLAGCGDDDSADAADSDPAAVLATFQDVRNAGDIDALMALYADDAVVIGHPRDSDGTATGVDEIRALEFDVPSFQRPEDATEFFNIQVEGNRVTFDSRFFNNRGDCFGTSGNEMTIEDQKITLDESGESDDSLCA